MAADSERLRAGGPEFAIVLVPNASAPEQLLRLLRSLRGQIYPNWRAYLRRPEHREPFELGLDEAAGEDSRIKLVADPVAPAAIGRADFVALLNRAGEIAPDALLHVAEAIRDDPVADIIYADEDSLSPEGTRYAPQFRSQFSPEQSLSSPDFGNLWFVRRKLLHEVYGDTAPESEAMVSRKAAHRCLGAKASVRHVPYVWFHGIADASAPSPKAKARTCYRTGQIVAEALAARNLRADVFVPPIAAERNVCLHQLRWRREPVHRERVTIIIPTRDHHESLARCIDSLERTVDPGRAEILVVDDESERQETVAYLNSLGTRPIKVRVSRAPRESHGFNFSRLVNHGAHKADTEVVLLLNDDVEAHDAGWLDEMLGWLSLDGVGAVGAMLLHRDDRVQHAGVVIDDWQSGLPQHLFPGLAIGDPGYRLLPHVARNVSAVTGACLLTRKVDWQAIGGFDEAHFAVDYNDVDFCLRLQDRGKRIVFTPQAQLTHSAFGSRRSDLHDPGEHLAFLRRHGSRQDPFLSPNLCVKGSNLTVRSGHFVHAKRFPSLRVTMITPADAGAVLLQQLHSLAECGIQLTLVTDSDGWFAEQARRSGTEVFVADRFSESHLADVAIKCKTAGVDLLVCRAEPADFPYEDRFGARLVWELTSNAPAFDAIGCGNAEEMHSRFCRAERVLVYSDAIGAILSRAMPGVQTEVIRPVIDSTRIEALRNNGNRRQQLRRKIGAENEQVVIANFAPLAPRHGQHVIMDALRTLRDETTSKAGVITLVFCGRGEVEYKKFLAASFSQSSGINIRFIDSGADMFDVLASADLAVDGGFRAADLPQTALSMAFGLPVVAAASPGIDELIASGGDGLLHKSGDAAALAGTLRWLIENPAERMALGRKACAKATRLFDARRTAQRYADTLRQIYASGRVFEQN